MATEPTSAFKRHVYPICVLVLICGIAGSALGYVHGMTQPKIDEAAAAKKQSTFESLVDTATDFEEQDIKGDNVTTSVIAKDADDQELARIYVGQGTGYGGIVPVAVAVDTEGTVIGVTVMANKETPGLGSKVESESYLDQYVGRSLAPVTEDDVDLISGATYSSEAVMSAFNACAREYEEAK